MTTSNKAIYLKIPILGSSNVGKTTLFNSFRAQTSKRFSYKTNEFIFLENVHHGNYIFNIQIWDAMGINTYKKSKKDIFENASTAIVMYDVSDTTKRSYKDLRNWVERLWVENGNGQIPILIVGNKIDLRKSNIPTLHLDECISIAKELHQVSTLTIPIVEISAITGDNCYQIFDYLLDLVIDFYLKNSHPFTLST